LEDTYGPLEVRYGAEIKCRKGFTPNAITGLHTLKFTECRKRLDEKNATATYEVRLVSELSRAFRIGDVNQNYAPIFLFPVYSGMHLERLWIHS